MTDDRHDKGSCRCNRISSCQRLDESYVYDSFGNLQQSGNVTFEQAFTSANQISGWKYDAAGNLLSDGISGNYTYDANEMVSSDNGTAYYYDAMGNRVGKTGTTPTDTIYFGGMPIARLTVSGGVPMSPLQLLERHQVGSPVTH